MIRTITFIASLALAFTPPRAITLSKSNLRPPARLNRLPLKSRMRRSERMLGSKIAPSSIPTRRETTLLLHAQKAFLKINPEQLKSQAQALKDLLGTKTENSGNIELKPTGKKETINGFDTEEYTTNFNGIQMSIFVAKQFPNYRKLVEALYQVQSGPAMDILRSMSIPPDKYPGLPIRTTESIMGQKIVVLLDSAQETDVPDSEFVIPADYKELNPRESGE